MGNKEKMKDYIDNNEILVAPGVFSALSALIMDKAGFPSVYVSGYGAAANILAKPDIGLLTMTEMVNHVQNISNAVKNIVIADADTGYGNYLNVRRTVQEYEKAGADCIQLEDQIWPKRCGHMEGKKIISKDNMIEKIRAAVDVRQSEDTLIIARTDAIAVQGFDEAINRAKAYHAAGADILFVEAPRGNDVKKIPKLVGAPCLANMVEGGKTSLYNIDQLEKMGYAVVIYPVSALYMMTKSINELVQELKEKGTTESMKDRMVNFSEFNSLIGLEEIREMQNKFTIDE